MRLLNIDANAKTRRGAPRGYMTGVLYLTPASASGAVLCPTAHTAGCAAGCLSTAGRGGIAAGNATMVAPDGRTVLPDNAVQRARLARTALFNTDRAAFMALLVDEIAALVRKASRAGRIPAVRLNGTSDIRWEAIPCGAHANVFAAFPDVQFYDYTKIPNRRVSAIRNYHLTFSYSGVPAYAPIVVRALANYGDAVNYAAVFAGPAPAAFLGRAVVDGDADDLRFLDGRGLVVALKAKGRARSDRSGFVVRVAA